MKKNNMIALLGITSICLAHSAFAMQEKIVSADSEVEAFISARDLTRIKAVEDRIRAIRASDGELELTQDKQLGEIYLRPANDTLAPINIFVTTEKGFTYKLLMIPKRIPSEQIILKNKGVLSKEGNTVTAKQSDILELMQLLQERDISQDKAEVVDMQGYQAISHSVDFDRYMGEVLIFKNTGYESVEINNSLFNGYGKGKLVALSSDLELLDIEQETKVYLIWEVEHE